MGDQLKTQKRLEEILAEWDFDQEGYEVDMSSISLPSMDDTITISASQTSPYTYTSGIGLGAYPNTIYTTGAVGTNTAPWMTSSTLSAPKIQLDGKDADIRINDWSLVDAVKRIEERLGLYQPNPELEKEWEELRALGDEYRRLEQHIKDKQATFDRLKAMPAPELD